MTTRSKNQRTLRGHRRPCPFPDCGRTEGHEGACVPEAELRRAATVSFLEHRCSHARTRLRQYAARLRDFADEVERFAASPSGDSLSGLETLGNVGPVIAGAVSAAEELRSTAVLAGVFGININTDPASTTEEKKTP